MMSQQQPDKFFREKLAHFQQPAPASAWDRIEANIKKNEPKRFVWWRIAASLLLLLTAGYFLMPELTGKKHPMTYKKNSVLLVDTTGQSIPPTTQKSEPDKEASHDQQFENNLATNATKKAAEKQISKRRVRRTQQVDQPLDTALTASPQAQSAAENDFKENNLKVEPVVSQAPAAPVTKKIKLQFTLEETNKYLDQNAVAEATSDEKKSSTLKKVLRKANDLKTNQDPYGDLRDIKNEILALNFKSEKREQNK